MSFELQILTSTGTYIFPEGNQFSEEDQNLMISVAQEKGLRPGQSVLVKISTGKVSLSVSRVHETHMVLFAE